MWRGELGSLVIPHGVAESTKQRVGLDSATDVQNDGASMQFSRVIPHGVAESKVPVQGDSATGVQKDGASIHGLPLSLCEQLRNPQNLIGAFTGFCNGRAE